MILRNTVYTRVNVGLVYRSTLLVTKLNFASNYFFSFFLCLNSNNYYLCKGHLPISNPNILSTNGPGDLGSIPGRVIPKTQKMVLDPSLLNTQHYKVWIKGKVEQSWEGVAPSPTPWCSSYRKGRLRVTLDYGRQLYLLIYGTNNSRLNTLQLLSSLKKRILPNLE